MKRSSVWKKIVLLCFLLIFAATGTIFAGGSSETLTVSDDPYINAVREKLQGTTITIASMSHTSSNAMREMVDEFTAETGIKVRWDIMEEGLLREKILMDHHAGTGTYDVLFLDAFNLSQYSAVDVMIDLKPLINDSALTPSWFDYEDILPAYRDGVGSYGGVAYGIPVAGESRFLAYRKDLFDKYGKTPPATTDELLETAKFFNEEVDGVYGIAMRAQKGIHFASGWMTLMYSMGGQFLDQKTWDVLVDSPATVDSLKYYVELMQQGPPDISVYTHEEAISAFMAGKTAMWIDATAIASWILDPSKSTITDKVEFAPLPAGPAGAYAPLAGWSAGISSDVSDTQKEAAWAFIVWMTGKKHSLEYVHNGGVIVRESLLTNGELVAKDKSLPAQLLTMKEAANLVKDGIIWIPPHPKAIKVLEIVGNYGNDVLSGISTPEKAMEKAQTEVEMIMNE
jgi:ABC-type glycerol-3-phosphate transport system substrate-binding protein